MLRTIYLHDELGELFGEVHQYAVTTIGEALRALDANKPGFLKKIHDLSTKGLEFRVQLGERDIDQEELMGPLGVLTPMHITPMIAGAKAGMVKTIIGAVIIVAAVVLSPYTGGASFAAAMGEMSALGVSYGAIVMFGASLMFAGISQMLTVTPKAQEVKNTENQSSYMFNGPVNTMAQGGPVPVGYGRLIVGSATISASLSIVNIPVGTQYSTSTPTQMFVVSADASEFEDLEISVILRVSTVALDGEAYVGSNPKLLVLACPELGIDTDIELATIDAMTTPGEWVLTTLKPVTTCGSAAEGAHGLLSFCITAVNTAGYVRIDKWSSNTDGIDFTSTEDDLTVGE